MKSKNIFRKLTLFLIIFIFISPIIFGEGSGGGGGSDVGGGQEHHDDCSPGQTQSRSCGSGGTQTRTCTSNHRWSSWSSCNECTPGTWDPVNCRGCLGNGQWNTGCTDYGGGSTAQWCSCEKKCTGTNNNPSCFECTPGTWDPVNCRGCLGNGQWNTGCTDYGGGSTAQWCSCEKKCTGTNNNPSCFECTPGQIQNQGCGNCGSQTRICNSNGQWSSFGSCTGQGCSPGSTQNCGVGGTKTCSGSCSWSSCEGERECNIGQTDSRACGNCGSQTRICNSNYQWNSWSSCSGQGACSPGSIQGCGVGGTKTCSGSCSWSSCEEPPRCGDNIVNLFEQCELPGTLNNIFCTQQQNICDGKKTGTRDALGNCNSVCGCVEDNYNYNCVKNSCGASCSVNSDCEDGNINTIDTCLNDCSCDYELIPYCGDGNKDAGEECDNGNLINGDGCNSNCVIEFCGDGILQDIFEECDDGNLINGDGCSAECLIEIPEPVCGNGVVEIGEECEPPFNALASCSLFGEDYLQDYCNENCMYADDWCETQWPGCTADIECDEIEPGTNGCDLECGFIGECSNDLDCDDELYCNGVETCDLQTHTCESGTAVDCGDGVGCTGDVCNENTDSCENIPDDLICDNGLWCDGAETCDTLLGCQSGTSVDCSDNLFCTINEVCDENSDSCISEPKDCSGNNIFGISECFWLDDGFDFTYDYRLEFLSTCDENLDICTEGDDSIEHTCDVTNCDAECAVNSDCEDGNINTMDTCLNDCSCDYESIPYCGDNNLDSGEECDDGNNAYGDGCDSNCVIEFCGDGILQDIFEECDDGNLINDDGCDSNCVIEKDCDIGETQTQACGNCGSQTRTCNSNYQWNSWSSCSGQGACSPGSTQNCGVGGTKTCSSSCSWNSCEEPPRCGDNIVNLFEQCELPGTLNNIFCSQQQNICEGKKTGTRDALGNCNSVCGCVEDNYEYECVKNSCGASCSVNSDCGNKCIGNTRYYGGSCSDSCGCLYESQNCDDLDYYEDYEDYCKDNSHYRTRRFHDFSCSAGGCAETIGLIEEEIVENCSQKNGIMNECGLLEWSCSEELNQVDCVIVNIKPENELCLGYCDGDILNQGLCNLMTYKCDYAQKDCNDYNINSCNGTKIDYTCSNLECVIDITVIGCNTCCDDESECPNTCDLGVHGDGIINNNEDCDDGNLINGDGCSSSGNIETGWVCSGQPSVCNIRSSSSSSGGGGSSKSSNLILFEPLALEEDEQIQTNYAVIDLKDEKVIIPNKNLSGLLIWMLIIGTLFMVLLILLIANKFRK